jgi:hypothetical protein
VALPAINRTASVESGLILWGHVLSPNVPRGPRLLRSSRTHM